MLYLVKIEPDLFLMTHAPVKSGVLKVSPEVSVGIFSIEDQQAAGDGTGEPWRTCIGGCAGGWNFEGARGGNGLSGSNSFTFGGRNLSGHGAIGLDFMGVAGHDW